MKISELASLLCTEPQRLADFAGVFTHTALTDAEAENLSQAWVLNEAPREPEAPVQVEYLPEGGETIHEPNLNANHSQCYEPGVYCPTEEHAYVQPRSGWDF